MTRNGWLAKRPELPASCEGVDFDPAMPTRREEYWFVRDMLQGQNPLYILDAGSGLTPHQHVMPYILSRMGHAIEAMDADPKSLEMPPDTNVSRVLGLLQQLPYPDASFNVVICISVLEHVDPDIRKAFAKEAARVCQPDGMLIVTADMAHPQGLAKWFEADFECGPTIEKPEVLTDPWVGYLVGRRLASPRILDTERPA